MTRRLEVAVKRSIDVVGAAMALVVLAPVLAWTALAVWIAQGPPIFFCHQRPGLHGKLFTVAKFRTMRAPRRAEVWYDSDPQRVTRVGRFLRAASIDELPQLLAVLKGDMSLVGPRPLLVEYLGQYTPDERRRHDVRPGITGWAQVNGRNVSRFEDRLRMDTWYVDNWTIFLDLRILFMTVQQVLRRADVAPTQDLEDIDFPDRFRAGLNDAIAARDQGSHTWSGDSDRIDA